LVCPRNPDHEFFKGIVPDYDVQQQLGYCRSTTYFYRATSSGRGYNEFISNISPDQIAGNEAAIKKQYLDSYISQYAILMKAVEEGVFDNPEMQTYFRAAVLQSVFQVYFQYLMIKTHPNFAPSAEEMNAFYQQNIEQIVSMGLNSDQIRSLITQQLTEQKMQIWMKQQLDVVRKSTASNGIRNACEPRIRVISLRSYLTDIRQYPARRPVSIEERGPDDAFLDDGVHREPAFRRKLRHGRSFEGWQ
jgi:hypothetical protein